jgi:class 3 adenylate cyclase
VLGDIVNTASRLESSVAKPGMVVIGENTQLMVTDQFEFKSLGSLTLKGKEREVCAFEVTGLSRAGAAASPGVASQEA